MADQLEFKISEGLIKPIIEAKINAAIVEAMGGHDKLVADMMTAYMNQKVDSEGKEDRYSNGKPRFEWLMNKMLTEAMKSALESYLSTKKEMLQKEFEKFFNSKKGASQVVSAMQDGLCAALTSKWNIHVNFNPPRD